MIFLYFKRVVIKLMSNPKISPKTTGINGKNKNPKIDITTAENVTVEKTKYETIKGTYKKNENMYCNATAENSLLKKM